MPRPLIDYVIRIISGGIKVDASVYCYNGIYRVSPIEGGRAEKKRHAKLNFKCHEL